MRKGLRKMVEQTQMKQGDTTGKKRARQRQERGVTTDQRNPSEVMGI